MPSVTYCQSDGAEETLELAAGTSLMEGAVDNGIPGIVGQCGGAATCGTCHCYVDADWFPRLPPPGQYESDLLEYVWEPAATSRLACQIKLTDDLDGLVVTIPERQI